MGLKQEILAAREHAKSFDYHQRSKCKQNLLELMAELYGEGWDPDLEAAEQPQHPSKHPERQAVKTQPADPNFLKLGVFALFVKVVFTLPISSAIVESLFSKYAPPLCTPRLAAFRHSLVEAGVSGMATCAARLARRCTTARLPRSSSRRCAGAWSGNC